MYVGSWRLREALEKHQLVACMPCANWPPHLHALCPGMRLAGGDASGPLSERRLGFSALFSTGRGLSWVPTTGLIPPVASRYACSKQQEIPRVVMPRFERGGEARWRNTASMLEIAPSTTSA